MSPSKLSRTASQRNPKSPPLVPTRTKMKGYNKFAATLWRYDSVEYLIEHPPPLPLAEEGKEFLTKELLVSAKADNCEGELTVDAPDLL